MSETDTARDDPFADIADPAWTHKPLPKRTPGGRTAEEPGPAPPTVPPSDQVNPVLPPPLPPAVGQVGETEWSRVEPEGTGSEEASTETEESVEAEEPDEPMMAPAPVEADESEGPQEAEVARVAEPILVGANAPTVAESLVDAQPLEIPPGFWGPEDADIEIGVGDGDGDGEPELPLIDRTARDTVGLVTNLLGPVLWLGAIGAAWYFLTKGATPVVAARNWPTPADTWDALLSLVETTQFRETVFDTMGRLLAAVVVGASGGLAVGALVGRRRVIRNLVRPATAVFRLVSPLLMLFFLAVWGGSGWWVEWVPAALAVFAITTWRTSRALGTTPRGATTVSGPRIVRGVRGALVLAWTLVLAAELVSGVDGIAPAMVAAQEELPTMVAWLAVATILAIVVDAALRLVEHLLSRG